MTKVYLFDWGDTLMIDFPGVPGKMCDWEKVEAVDGAEEALRHLSASSKIYIATGAKESTESEIEAALQRVGLEKYISGYFCQANIGEEKGSSLFLSKVLKQLKRHAKEVTVVGDSLKFDIQPALALGINAVWLSEDQTSSKIDNVRVISSLRDLGL